MGPRWRSGAWLALLSMNVLASGCSSMGFGPPAAPHTSCDPGLWDHVYHPGRLEGNRTCFMVHGKVWLVRAEPDGDRHVRVELDDGHDWMINEYNDEDQHGDLVVEVVCVDDPPQQPDARDACAGYENHVNLPEYGDHVYVTGTFVTDVEHGWNELHPVSDVSPG